MYVCGVCLCGVYVCVCVVCVCVWCVCVWCVCVYVCGVCVCGVCVCVWCVCGVCVWCVCGICKLQFYSVQIQHYHTIIGTQVWLYVSVFSRSSSGQHFPVDGTRSHRRVLMIVCYSVSTE